MTSLSSEQETIHLMKKVLKENGNICLHKIVSNSVNVMKAFPAEDLGVI